MYGLKTECSFDSAHFLSNYHGKCENLHGHRWHVVVSVEQKDLQAEGNEKDMVFDFSALKSAVRNLACELDHTFIVEEGSLSPETIACLEKEEFTLFMVPFRTTAENLARYFGERLIALGFPVAQIELYETPHNCALYRPDPKEAQ